MDQKLNIVIIEGSTREKRESMKAARFVADIGRTFPEIDLVLVDPSDFNFPNDGNDTEGKDARYTKITAKADGFFIVTPEYNHSFPGSLKRMLDSEYENYFRKPVALAGVSNGGWGGTRAVENLLPSLRTMGLVALQFTTYFPRVQDIFDEQGSIRPEFQKKYTQNIQYEFRELVWMARALKWGRETLAKPEW